MQKTIPEEILTAVNALLAPYGAKFTRNTEPTGRGYTDYAGAIKYTGLSRATLYRAIRGGKLRCFCPTDATSGYGKTVRFAFDDLDSFMTHGA